MAALAGTAGLHPATLPAGATATAFVLQSDGRQLSASWFRPAAAATEGAPPAGAVLFFHGSLATKEWLTTLLSAAVANGFHAFAIDQAGHGRSSGSRSAGDTDTLAVDATALASYAAAQAWGD